MNKDRWSLVPWNALRLVARVFTFGADKHDKKETLGYHARDTKIDFDAAMRHIADYQCGIESDHESGLHPLVHAIARMLVIVSNDEIERRKKLK